MGGERETVVESKKKASGATKVGKIRIHESGGQVHFHDDDAKLKVAVPVSSWFEIFQKVSTGGSETVIDPVNKTILLITVRSKKMPTGYMLTALLSIDKCSPSPEFELLHLFTHGN